MEQVSVLILAAGSTDEWPGYMGAAKHLLPIREEPLIHRTIRLAAELGASRIGVVTQDERAPLYVVPPACQVRPHDIDRPWVHEWEQSRWWWPDKGRLVILYGDVFYSERLLATMLDDEADDWHVYARHGGSLVTGKPHGEMWGWVLRPHQYALLDSARRVAVAYRENELWWRCLGWEVYRIACNQVPWHHHRDEVHFVEWDDETEDFDRPDEWAAWLERTARWAV